MVDLPSFGPRGVRFTDAQETRPARNRVVPEEILRARADYGLGWKPKLLKNGGVAALNGCACLGAKCRAQTSVLKPAEDYYCTIVLIVGRIVAFLTFPLWPAITSIFFKLRREGQRDQSFYPKDQTGSRPLCVPWLVWTAANFLLQSVRQHYLTEPRSNQGSGERLARRQNWKMTN
jgi:hypothetical protein